MMSFNGTRSGPEPDIDRADSPVCLFGSLPSAYEDSYYIVKLVTTRPHPQQSAGTKSAGPEAPQKKTITSDREIVTCEL
jgi:hypothetical protein